MNPKLDSSLGFHSSNDTRGEPYWLDVTMPDDQFYKVSAFELQRRGDGCCQEGRQILAARFLFSYDKGKTWNSYENGTWLDTTNYHYLDAYENKNKTRRILHPPKYHKADKARKRA